MASKGDTVAISDAHADMLQELGIAGECLTLGVLGYGI